MIRAIVTWAAVALQILAAVLWYVSTVVKVSAKQVELDYQKRLGLTSGGPFQITITDDAIEGDTGYDFVETAVRQAKWSKWAALATGGGLALQAIATAIPAT